MAPPRKLRACNCVRSRQACAAAGMSRQYEQASALERDRARRSRHADRRRRRGLVVCASPPSSELRHRPGDPRRRRHHHHRQRDHQSGGHRPGRNLRVRNHRLAHLRLQHPGPQGSALREDRSARPIRSSSTKMPAEPGSGQGAARQGPGQRRLHQAGQRPRPRCCSRRTPARATPPTPPWTPTIRRWRSSRVDAATIAQKAATLKAAQINLNYTNIVSPVDGTVVTRNVTAGQTVAASLQTPDPVPDRHRPDQDAGRHQRQRVRHRRRRRRAPAPASRWTPFPTASFHGIVAQVRQSPISVQNVITYDVVIAVANPELCCSSRG